ncbi:Neurotransmitter-gated ion-channel ligand binding domain protein [Xenococcus sp. PCC 7305]|uniref:Neurotransmitter-gated ion-channel ligand binding domain protein n=1 Tax=Xenococcus sp. PCC 7305 TaxID=102125 RepID=UPI0002AD161B|nr:Neurotransmitter-gated ion-channel ligand binding domain protein [Xenococcus sp. PCC 7305]ELS01248.1 Neurotransmitter-gated ion-channel ligand binding domain protein [Xenococcus sp. PCC 7305]
MVFIQGITRILYRLRQKIPYSFCSVLFLLGLALSLLLNSATAQAPSSAAVQSLTGSLDAGETDVYTIADLQPGETFYAYIKGVSGNLDPIIALSNQRSDWSNLRTDFRKQKEQAVAKGQDPLEMFSNFANATFLTWDDDSGEGYDAAFEFQVREVGDYQLIVSSSVYTRTFGEYNLLLGIDQPEVLTGEAESTDAQIASLETILADPNLSVETVSGSLSADNPSRTLSLKDFKAGDNLYVWVEAISGDLKPIIELRDYGNKLLRRDNSLGEQTQAKFEYEFQDRQNSDFQLKILSNPENKPPTNGEYRLLIGINRPEVLTGEAEPIGPPILQQPTPVQIGLKLQQITGINQKEENFGIVASLRMEYEDSNLAFSPDTCQCRFKQFRSDNFARFVTEQGLTLPTFTIFNQQGKRFSQNTLAVVLSDGRVFYFERFTTTLQAPDFDFRQYPLDKQDFYIHIDSILPERFYIYEELEGFSEVGQQLGEEEWVVTSSGVTISRQNLNTGDFSSRFSFHFQAKRHLNYYVLRLFIPIFVIIIVSWLPFFLRDYGKRVDIASGNLLLFIAFNFTLSDELPRLGYVTFLDEILIAMFLISGVIVLLNVYLRRLEISGEAEKAEELDQFTIWGYPVLYLIVFALVLIIS